MKTQIFDTLYKVEANLIDTIDNNILENNFIFQGSKNWDFYFINKPNVEFDTFNKVKIIEFNSKDNFEDFLNSNDVLDYSIEHDKPIVVTYV